MLCGRAPKGIRHIVEHGHVSPSCNPQSPTKGSLYDNCVLSALSRCIPKGPWLVFRPFRSLP
eukprot:6485714-Amphidinium_carterae.2